MAHLYNTKQNENEFSQDFVKRCYELSYKCPNASSHNSIWAFAKNNLEVEVRSLIVGVRIKTMTWLIEATTEVKGIVAKLKKNPPKVEQLSPAITLVRVEGKKEAFNMAKGRNI